MTTTDSPRTSHAVAPAAQASPATRVPQTDTISPAEMALIGGDALRDRNAALKAKRQAMEMDLPLDGVTILGGKIYVNNKGLTIMLRRDERGPGSVAVEVVKDAWDDCILDTIRQRMGSTSKEAVAKWADAGLMRAKCKARISFPDGSHYEAYGDASIITMGMPAMHNPDYSNHMAETRSVNRAIRRATGMDTSAEEMAAGVSRDVVTELGIDGPETPAIAAPSTRSASPAPTRQGAAATAAPGKSERQQLWEQITALRPDADGKGLEGHLADIARDLSMQVHEHRDTIEIGYLRAMLDDLTRRAKRPGRTVDTTAGEILEGEVTPADEPAAPQHADSLPYVALLNKLNAAAALEPAARNAQVDALVGNARALLDGGEITAAEYEAVSVRAEAISPVAAIGDLSF